MNAERYRSVLLVLAAGCGLLLGPAAAQPPAKDGGKEKEGGPDAARRPDFQVMRLKSANAVDTARVLDELFNGKGNNPAARIVAEPATNSLLIQASPADFARIKAVLGKLDVPDADSDRPRPQVRVFALRALEPDKFLQDALQLVIPPGGGYGNFALDPQRKQVVVSADDPTLRTVEALLSRLEDHALGRPTPNVQVRVVWLVSGATRADAAGPPDDLKEVLPGLAKLGIDRPRLAAQMLVNVTPNTQFQAKGVTELGGRCRFALTGRLSDKQEPPELEITLRAERSLPGGTEELGNLQTQISAPLGHLVVLGVTPTENLTSVFVVQVLPREATRQGPRR
jgi:hypothetical protein